MLFALLLCKCLDYEYLFHFRNLTLDIEMSSAAISPDIEQWLLMDEKVRKSQSVVDVQLIYNSNML